MNTTNTLLSMRFTILPKSSTQVLISCSVGVIKNIYEERIRIYRFI